MNYALLLGAYSLPNGVAASGFITAAPSYTIAARHNQGLISEGQHGAIPGPASYGIPPLDRGPAFSISGRIETTHLNDTPGPGTYPVKSDIGNAPAFSISGWTHTNDGNSGNTNSNNTNENNRPHSSPAYTMARRKGNSGSPEKGRLPPINDAGSTRTENAALSPANAGLLPKINA